MASGFLDAANIIKNMYFSCTDVLFFQDKKQKMHIYPRVSTFLRGNKLFREYDISRKLSAFLQISFNRTQLRRKRVTIEAEMRHI